ncbi:carboxylating nicotinate-nucleotide diphosphorylase [Kaarinaea lacus]
MTNPPVPVDIQQVVQNALAEDIGTGDITAALIPKSKQSHAQVICRENAVLCGIPWFEEVFHQLDDQIRIEWQAGDGDVIQADQVICFLEGNARHLLSGERVALNFLQTLSAVSTRTRAYVEAIKDTDTQILDTRKTLPGLRTAQKYAVNCGGGKNHRMGLYDAYLVKENHILAAGSIESAVAMARTNHPDALVEVEVENLAELQQAIDAGVDQVLLDNMSLDTLREAVAITRGRALLEASGGVTLDTVRSIAETGVDFISVGGLTKNIRAIDLSMRFL